MIGDVNPFVYSHPVSPDDIIDRERETRELLVNAVGGHYVRPLRAAQVRQDEPAAASAPRRRARGRA